ncbi:MAG: hypothetical protein K9G62_02670 [Alphaproteobacteria bacterium]|nr:hypothetical protein [Alphaproteobacteria bacterium]
MAGKNVLFVDSRLIDPSIASLPGASEAADRFTFLAIGETLKRLKDRPIVFLTPNNYTHYPDLLNNLFPESTNIKFVTTAFGFDSLRSAFQDYEKNNDSCRMGLVSESDTTLGTASAVRNDMVVIDGKETDAPSQIETFFSGAPALV